MADAESVLPSWNEGPSRSSIIDFVEAVAGQGIPHDERIAVFDNDGTLWCEKPMPVQLHFILERFSAMAEKDSSLREKQPFKAAVEKDFNWLGATIDAHYAGDDTQLKILLGALMQSFEGVDVEDYQRQAYAFITGTKNPANGRLYSECTYAPMVELLQFLKANDFRLYIASGGDRDFMRPISMTLYGIPTQRVIGSTFGLSYEDGPGGGSVVYKAAMDVFDDGPTKPARIWSRVGQRPIMAGGNSNGDMPMLRYAGGRDRPSLQLLVLHDDADREFDYVKGAEACLDAAKAEGWTVVSMKNDWTTVFG